jgi:hypothetical protein
LLPQHVLKPLLPLLIRLQASLHHI